MSKGIYRRDLLALLEREPMSVNEIARLMEVPPADVQDDLQHLLKSLRHTGQRIEVQPAHCRKCGFRFKEDKLRKPGRCPICKGSWISEPKIAVKPAH